MNVSDLPESARARLLELEGSAADAADVVTGAQRRINAFNNRTDPAVIGRTRAARERGEQRFEALHGLASRIRQWAIELPAGAAVEVAEPVDAAPQEGESLAVAIARVRAAIAGAVMERHAVATAPLPKAALKALAAEKVRELVAYGRPRLSVEKNLFDVRWDDACEDFGVKATYVAAVLAWCDPGLVQAALERDIDALEVRGPMPAVERTRRVAELTAAIDALERGEESLVAAAEASGLDILRRENAAPTAVLGVVVQAAKAKAAA